MLRRMGARRFNEWKAYHEVEPFFEERADFRTAQIVAAVMNLGRNAKVHPKPFLAKDVLLTIGAEEPAPPRRQTWQEQRAIAQMMAEVFNDERRS